MRARAGAALGAALLSVWAAGAPACAEKRDDGTSPAAAAPDLPPLALRDDTPNLMLTWVDEKGETHVEVHPPDVPAAGKDLVRVVVADREDGTKDLFYVADLSKKDEAGGYVVRTMRRRDWEAVIEKRREAHLARIAPPRAPTGAPAPPPAAITGATVIIYGAHWCKPCHEAAAYLKQRGVPFVEKDIESSEPARREMQAKLEKVGRRGGSIPVIDVRGEILVGFSTSAIDRALAKAGKGTVL